MLNVLTKLLLLKKNNKKDIRNKIYSKGKKILEVSFKEINYYLR